MLKCKKCVYSRSIPGDAHISCSRKAARAFNVNEGGVEKGYFFFPFNFDPIWAEGCYGFVDKNERPLTELTKEELGKVLQTEVVAINIVLRNENEDLKTREAVMAKYSKAIEAIPHGPTDESTIVLIEELRKI